jgi:hypothetical protein
MPKNMHGQPLQHYQPLGRAYYYLADANGAMPNVADDDVEDLDARGCVVDDNVQEAVSGLPSGGSAGQPLVQTSPSGGAWFPGVTFTTEDGGAVTLFNLQNIVGVTFELLDGNGYYISAQVINGDQAQFSVQSPGDAGSFNVVATSGGLQLQASGIPISDPDSSGYIWSDNGVLVQSGFTVPTTGKVTTQTGTSYTLQASDSSTTILFTNNSAVTVTCPNNLGVGFNVELAQMGTGKVSPSAASGASLNNAHGFTGTAAQYAVIGVSVLQNSGGSSAAYVMVGDGA